LSVDQTVGRKLNILVFNAVSIGRIVIKQLIFPLSN